MNKKENMNENLRQKIDQIEKERKKLVENEDLEFDLDSIKK